jgi:hypothetical protein
MGALLAAAAIFLSVAIAMRDARRADHFIYGRYLEIIQEVLLVAAVAAIVGGKLRARTVAVVVAVGAALAVPLTVARGDVMLHEKLIGIHTPAILGMRELAGGVPRWDFGIRLLPLTIMAGVVFTLLIALAHLHRSLPIAAAICLFVASSAYGPAQQFAEENGRLAERHTLSDVAGALIGDSDLSYDLDHHNAVGFYGYQYWLPDTRFLAFRSSTSTAPTDLVITTKAWQAGAASGARLAFVENDIDQALWVLPGAIQDRMESAGLLLSSSFPGPLPSDAYRSSIAMNGTDVIKVRSGRTTTVRLTVTHTGGSSPWPQQRGVGSEVSGGISIGAVWQIDGELHRIPGGGQLPRTVYPGETVRIDYPLQLPPETGLPLAPGRYRVGFGPVHSQITWFDQQGDRLSWFDVDVLG